METAKKNIKIYGVLSAAALLTVVAVAATGHPVNPFMWVRAILLPFVAVLLHRLTVAIRAHRRRSAGGAARRRTVAGSRGPT